MPPRACPHHLELANGGDELVYTYDTRASAPASPRLLNDLRAAGIAFKDLTRRRARSRTSSSTSSGAPHEPSRDQRAIYKFEMARSFRTLLQSIVSPVIRPRSTSSCSARRSARASPDRRHSLRRLHRAGPDHAGAAHRERRQRLVRHLPSALHGHDLRGAVGARVGVRDRRRLRRRGRDEVDHARGHHPGHGLACSCRSRSRIPSGCSPSWY